MMRILSLFLLLTLCCTSCATYSDDQLDAFDQEIEAYIKKKDLKLERSSSGLYYTIENPGEGNKIQFKDRVAFKYKGSLLNGKVIDEQTEPIEFQVEELIGAWQETMLMLRPGGKAFIIAPPQLGYGEHDLDDIPQNSILIFELEVIEVK